MNSLSGSTGLENRKPLNGRQVTVSAPGRLHFGLLSIGNDLPVNFGGAGLMLRNPRTEIRIGSAESFSVDGAEFNWIEQMVRHWQTALGAHASGLPPVRIEVSISPPRHFGLGSGTQMALSLASALCRYFEMGEPAPGELAMLMDRGRRSSIGSHGFFQGGFLVDRGLAAGDSFSPLDLRLEFPADWPIVLILPNLAAGSHGAEELEAFDRAARGDADIRQQMVGLLNRSIVPAIAARNFPLFATALHEFNTLSGDYYRSVQGGTWHSREVAEIVGHVRRLGVPGIIQSSWGPGLAAFTDNLPAAQSLARQVGELGHPALAGNRISITRADNNGAVAEIFE